MNKFILLPSIVWLLSIGEATEETINFEDGFEDGNFTDGPEWIGDTDHFVVQEEEQGKMLRLSGDSEAGGVSYLSTPSEEVNGNWEFYLRLDFAPSGGNRAEIFLMSDREDLSGNVNGYALRAGEAGASDVFRIVRYEQGMERATVLSGETDISSGGAYRVKVSRSPGGTWALEVGEGYDGALRAEGETMVDSTYKTSSFFGLRATYTRTRAEHFFFDFRIDLPSFSVEHVHPGRQTLDLVFNRGYDRSSVQPEHFQLNHGMGRPSGITFPDTKTIRLHYEQVFPSADYSLALSIADLEGTVLPPDYTVSFDVFEPAGPEDLIINEFLYDPPAGSAEYVELRNISGKHINLQDWKIGDDTRLVPVSVDTAALPAGGLAVITADTAALSSYYGNRGYLRTQLPALNNTGDLLQLDTPEGDPSDSLRYEPSWGGKDVALERRSASAPSGYAGNWGPSPHSSGGTPGRENEVEADHSPPEWLSLQVQNATTLLLQFSKPLDPHTAEQADNYQLSPALPILNIAPEAETVHLYLDQPMSTEAIYELSVSGIRDIFGNSMQTTAKQIQFVDHQEPVRGDVIINEFNYDPTSTGVPEFIELYNASEKMFNLEQWLIGDENGYSEIHSPDTFSPDEYLVLTGSKSFASSLDNSLYLPEFPALNNDTDRILLQSQEGAVIDSLQYTASWGGREGTLERRDPLAASADPANWVSHPDPVHSAGTKNSAYEPDNTPPEPVFAKVRPDQSLEVLFNEFVVPSGTSRFESEGQTFSVQLSDTKGSRRLLLEPTSSPEAATGGKLTIRNLPDVKGNTARQTEVDIAHPLQPGDLAINEIMFAPINDPNDKLPNQSEYLELTNTRDHAISLEGLVVHDAPDENGELRSISPLSLEKWIPAGGHALLYADEAATFEESRTAVYFELQPGDNNTLMQADRATLSLAASGDAVYVADSSGAVVDSVYYDESWHNPNLIDTRGRALERISPVGPSNDATNWGTSVHKKGGTPNGHNSIYQTEAPPPQDLGITFTPNPFSPDSDGHEDHLFIQYQLDQPDYLLKVRIYDRYGRLVRKLADSEPAGYEGRLIWDGLRDDSGRNRIGIYIVVVEAYGSASGGPQTFKKSVVLARQLN